MLDLLKSVHEVLKASPVGPHEALVMLAWLIAFFVVFSTVCPAWLRPHFAEPEYERFGAYLLVGLAFSAAYPDSPVLLALAVVLAAALLETAQLVIPGRYFALRDIREGAFGGFIGVVIGSIIYRLTLPIWHAHGM